MITINFLLLCLLILFTINNKKKYKKLYLKNEKTVNELNCIAGENKNLLTRIEELENGIETSFGVKVREIHNITNVNFTKLELICILSGIEKLIPSTKNNFDIQFYLNLIRKISNTIDSLGEENGI
jgi:hypothetical protein